MKSSKLGWEATNSLEKSKRDSFASRLATKHSGNKSHIKKKSSTLRQQIGKQATNHLGNKSHLKKKSSALRQLETRREDGEESCIASHLGHSLSSSLSPLPLPLKSTSSLPPTSSLAVTWTVHPASPASFLHPWLQIFSNGYSGYSVSDISGSSKLLPLYAI